MTGTAPDPNELLAAEYVLGLADATDVAEAKRRLAEDPDFAATVERWQERFAPWFDDAEARPHDPALHDRIMAALPQTAPIPANDHAPDVRRSLRLWRSAALIMTAASVALAVTLTLRVPAGPDQIAAAPAPVLLATLPLADTAAISLSVDHGSGRVMATPVGVVPDGVHVHEVWLMSADGSARSMGLVDPAAAHSLPAAAAILAELRTGARIAVSAEPLGGSRGAGPSGPVLATATLGEI